MRDRAGGIRCATCSQFCSRNSSPLPSIYGGKKSSTGCRVRVRREHVSAFSSADFISWWWPTLTGEMYWHPAAVSILAWAFGCEIVGPLVAQKHSGFHGTSHQKRERRRLP